MKGSESWAVESEVSTIDNTDRKHHETHLLQSQKMEALSTLAGGIAHDFSNALMTIIGYAEMIEMFDLSADSPIRPSLEEILKAANRAKSLVEQMLTFSRQAEKERTYMHLEPIVEEAVKSLRATLPSIIEIRQNFESATGAILANPTQMHQVLMSLSTNAAHAMRDNGGVLELGLAHFEIDRVAATRFLDLVPGSYIKLSVSDTGHGMDRTVMNRIFDPFFTTKQHGEGTGMGLAVVHGIVKSHGGAIIVESELGKGSVFQAYFPLVTSRPPLPHTEEAVSTSRGGGSIMFVDDERALTDLAKKSLEKVGYDVVVKMSGRDALEFFRSHPDQFDLVITDQSMSQMTGIELAQELMRVRPDIPIILCTGYSETVREEHAQTVGIRKFICKPLGTRILAETVREVLNPS